MSETQEVKFDQAVADPNAVEFKHAESAAETGARARRHFVERIRKELEAAGMKRSEVQPHGGSERWEKCAEGGTAGMIVFFSEEDLDGLSELFQGFGLQASTDESAAAVGEDFDLKLPAPQVELTHDKLLIDGPCGGGLSIAGGGVGSLAGPNIINRSERVGGGADAGAGGGAPVVPDISGVVSVVQVYEGQPREAHPNTGAGGAAPQDAGAVGAQPGQAAEPATQPAA